MIYQNTHPNVRIIKKNIDEKTKKFKNFILIEQIRELESFVYLSSVDNSPKFIIIDSADDLNLSSSNCLLKILEEPKPNTYFIFFAHSFPCCCK